MFGAAWNAVDLMQSRDRVGVLACFPLMALCAPQGKQMRV